MNPRFITAEIRSRPDDDPIVVAGRAAWNRHKEGQRKVFLYDWLPIGGALVVGRAWAIRESGADTARKDHRHGSAYYKLFGQWLRVNGFADIHDAVQKALFDIMDNLDAVQAWRATLTDDQQREWNSPTTVWKHYRETRPPAEPEPEPETPEPTPEPEPQPNPQPEPEPRTAAADTATAADTVTQGTVTLDLSDGDTDDDEATGDDDEATGDDDEALNDEAAMVLVRFWGEENCRKLVDGIEDWSIFGWVLEYYLSDEGLRSDRASEAQWDKKHGVPTARDFAREVKRELGTWRVAHMCRMFGHVEPGEVTGAFTYADWALVGAAFDRLVNDLKPGERIADALDRDYFFDTFGRAHPQALEAHRRAIANLPQSKDAWENEHYGVENRVLEEIGQVVSACHDLGDEKLDAALQALAEGMTAKDVIRRVKPARQRQPKPAESAPPVSDKQEAPVTPAGLSAQAKSLLDRAEQNRLVITAPERTALTRIARAAAAIDAKFLATFDDR